MIAIGRRVFGLGAVLLGGAQLAFGAFSADWLPVPASTPAYHLLAYAVGGLLVLAGLALNLPGIGRAAALALAAVFALGLATTLLPGAVLKPAGWISWQGLAESTGMTLGGVLAYALAPGVEAARSARLAQIAQLMFGVCLLIFGISHFVYAKFTAAVVPAWLPPSQMFWAYLTGGAQIAAGLAMLSGIQARLAAILLTIMYAIFGLLVHIPAILAKPSEHDNWAENAINLLLLGVAWCLADFLSKAPKSV